MPPLDMFDPPLMEALLAGALGIPLLGLWVHLAKVGMGYTERVEQAAQHGRPMAPYVREFGVVAARFAWCTIGFTSYVGAIVAVLAIAVDEPAIGIAVRRLAGLVLAAPVFLTLPILQIRHARRFGRLEPRAAVSPLFWFTLGKMWHLTGGELAVRLWREQAAGTTNSRNAGPRPVPTPERQGV